MAVKLILNHTGRILFLLFLTVLFSCEEQGLFVICDECDDIEPVSTELEIRLNENLETSVLINVYEGNLEDNNLVSSSETFAPISYFTVKLNRKYTITATYNLSDGTYVAVDSALPQVKFSKEACDNPCYWVYDRIINLKLKKI